MPFELGSPPLARERLLSDQFGVEGIGITPARAGKTATTYISTMPWQDHPRSRGKDSARLTASRIRSGSPPLARERPAAIPANAWTRRITPARAGKTDSTHGSAHTARDHPRSRGKDYIRRRMIPGCCGSPPLARERPGVSAGDVLYQGITPARAGKTGLRSPRLHSPWDHPRSRGKDSKRSLKNGDFSSPET